MGLLWSLTAIAFVFVLGEMIRIILQSVLTARQLHYARELISCFELSAVLFEIIVLGKFYNFWVGICCSFLLLTLKNMVFILDGALTNPCGLLEDTHRKPKKVAVLSLASTVVLQVAGAMMAYPFVRKLWQSTSSELHSIHLQNGISSTLEISIAAGFVIEAFATFLTTMSDLLSRRLLTRTYIPIIRSTFCVFLCDTLTRATGLWISPALATAHIFFAAHRYGSIDFSKHFIVYWLGLIVGTVLAYEMNSRFIEMKDSRICQRKSETIENKQKNRVLIRASGVRSNNVKGVRKMSLLETVLQSIIDRAINGSRT